MITTNKDSDQKWHTVNSTGEWNFEPVKLDKHGVPHNVLAFEVPEKPRPAFKSKIVKEDLVDSTWLNGDKPKPV